MSSDISRQRFNPARHFNSVLMQQGRVQLDADWNEWNEILDRRWRSETIDIIGRCVVPRQTPDGFAIGMSGGMLTIGRGRIYVDGLQAENHGAGDLEFDPVLAESRGLNPVRYDQQPDFPNPTPLPDGGGPHLVYLDVWEREVTAIEDPGLVETAVGVDTTSRLQTAWQVRVLPDIGDGTTCSTPDDQLPRWLDIIRPSAGRLTTAAVGVAQSDDPCLLPPSGGYRGLENRLYRVEIHDGGKAGAATFKWSRDNASIATGISAIEGDTTLTVDRAVWDSIRRFRPGDWVEISDDWRELSGAIGEIRRITSVIDASRTITLEVPLTPGLFPVDGQNRPDPDRHTRMKRWDQSGLVKDSTGATYLDLDAPGGTGSILVPDPGTSLLLEDGVQVTFNTDPDGGEFRPGDYWVFAARTADASVEELKAAPPRGVHHHYGRLAVVTFPDVTLDCRTFWPPSFEGASESCDCTLCVSAEQHNQGIFTLYQAADQLRQTGGTICLGPGIFNLVEKPVQLDGAFAVRIRGQGAATILLQPRGEAAFILRRCQWCMLDYLTIHSIGRTASAPAIRLANSVGTTIERLIIAPPAEGDGPLAGIWLEAGFLLLTKIRDNVIRAQSGVVFVPGQDNEDGALWLGSFCCERNRLQCAGAGIKLGRSSYYAEEVVLGRNVIIGSSETGIAAMGLAVSELAISGNTILPQKGDGIVVGTGSARITDNQVVNSDADAQNGIRIVPGGLDLPLAPIVIRGNRLQSLSGNGLTIETTLSVAVIEHNVFSAIAGNGLLMLPGSAAASMNVLANELIDIATGTAEATKGRALAAIHLRNVLTAAVAGNSVGVVGKDASVAAVIAGIRVDASVDLQVTANTVVAVAPPVDFVNPAAGVLVVGAIGQTNISNNVIRRQLAPNDDNSSWGAVRILGMTNEASTKLLGPGFANLSASGWVNAVSSLAVNNAQPERAGAVNNVLHGYGRGPLVEVAITGSCRFSDNQCSCLGERIPAAVALAAGAIIAAENRVECSRNSSGLDLKAGNAKAVTVVGNIVGGPILVNGAALSAPWQPLNVIGA
jgi:hypothetical protein